jgi:hypothetical protein
MAMVNECEPNRKTGGGHDQQNHAEASQVIFRFPDTLTKQDKVKAIKYLQDGLELLRKQGSKVKGVKVNEAAKAKNGKPLEVHAACCWEDFEKVAFHKLDEDDEEDNSDTVSAEVVHDGDSNGEVTPSSSEAKDNYNDDSSRTDIEDEDVTSHKHDDDNENDDIVDHGVTSKAKDGCNDDSSRTETEDESDDDTEDEKDSAFVATSDAEPSPECKEANVGTQAPIGVFKVCNGGVGEHNKH